MLKQSLIKNRSISSMTYDTHAAQIDKTPEWTCGMIINTLIPKFEFYERRTDLFQSEQAFLEQSC